MDDVKRVLLWSAGIALGIGAVVAAYAVIMNDEARALGIGVVLFGVATLQGVIAFWRRGLRLVIYVAIAQIISASALLTISQLYYNMN